MHRPLSFPLLSFFVLVACGSDTTPSEFDTFEEACAFVEGCGNAPSGPTEALWRVAVIRDPDGTYRLGEIDSVDVPEESGVPFGPFGGEVALVGRDAAGSNIDGQLLRFPDVVSFESSFDEGGRIEASMIPKTPS